MKEKRIQPEVGTSGEMKVLLTSCAVTLCWDLYFIKFCKIAAGIPPVNKLAWLTDRVEMVTLEVRLVK